MKTLFTLASALLTTAGLSAQITIDRSDFGTVGDLLYYANDTTLATNFSLGASGPNVTWNFSSTVVANFHDSAVFADPSTVQGAPEEANLAIIEGENGASFFNITDSTVKIVVPLDMLNGATNAQILISKFPFTYGDATVKDSVSTKIQGTPDDFGYAGAPFDSMRIVFDIHTSSTVDGWGNITTPAATYAALRVKNETNVDITVEGKLPIVGTWINVPVDGLDENQVMYGWYAEGKDYTVAEAQLDTLGNVVSFRYQVASIPVNTGIETVEKNITTSFQPNPVNDVLKLTFNSNYTEKGSLLIFDITGKVVVNQEIAVNKNENELTIKTADMNNGIYFTRIVSEHINSSSKFVVKH
jgi:hypothetical protein